MSFFKYFFATIVSLFLSYFLLVEIVNPQGTSFFKSSSFSQYQVNIEYAKYKALEKNKDFENLIIGSSTSEAFLPVDTSQVFGDTSYSLSLGGATTDARFVMIKKAIESNKNLKRIIYVADFYEFNKDQTKPTLLYNSEMSGHLITHEKSLIGRLRHYLNHQLLEDSLRVIKRSFKNKSIHINSDGTTNRSMILSPIKGEGLNKKIAPENYLKLKKEILENYITYSKNVLDHFEKLSPKSKRYFKEIISITHKFDIPLYIVISPYHKVFKEKLMTNIRLQKRYKEWRDFINGLANAKYKRGNVHVMDGSKLSFANDENSAVWRDGLHYNRHGAIAILNLIND